MKGMTMNPEIIKFKKINGILIIENQYGNTKHITMANIKDMSTRKPLDLGALANAYSKLNGDEGEHYAPRKFDFQHIDIILNDDKKISYTIKNSIIDKFYNVYNSSPKVESTTSTPIKWYKSYWAIFMGICIAIGAIAQAFGYLSSAMTWILTL